MYFIKQNLFALCLVLILYAEICYSQDDAVNESSTSTRTTQNIPKLPLLNYRYKSYYIGNFFKGRFFLAEQFCRYHGMNLVSITSDVENDYLSNKISEHEKTKQMFWTSGTKLPNAAKWVWFTTGKSINFTNWGKNYPSDNKDHECVSMQLENGHLKWANMNCWEEYYFVCEVTWRDCRGEVDHSYDEDDVPCPSFDVRHGP